MYHVLKVQCKSFILFWVHGSELGLKWILCPGQNVFSIVPKGHLSARHTGSFLPVSHYLQKPRHAGSAGDNKLCTDTSMAQEKEKKHCRFFKAWNERTQQEPGPGEGTRPDRSGHKQIIFMKWKHRSHGEALSKETSKAALESLWSMRTFISQQVWSIRKKLSITVYCIKKLSINCLLHFYPIVPLARVCLFPPACYL